MGLLSDLGHTLYYEQSKQHHQKVQKDGVIQFLNLLIKYSEYTLQTLHENLGKTNYVPACPTIFWGDEVESHLVQIDEKEQQVRLYVEAQKVLDLASEIKDQPFDIVPEFGAWMLEHTPVEPYHTLCQFSKVVESIRARQLFLNKLLQDKIGPNIYNLVIPNYPLLGVGDFHTPFNNSTSETGKEAGEKGREQSKEIDFKNYFTHSLFIDDRLSNPHPRFPTLALNIRERRGQSVEILVPIYQDKNTSYQKTQEDPFPGFVYMDAMAFGMGCSCLQTTFSARNLEHSRWLHDQFGILAPIFMCLSAGSPIFKGKLVDTDTRWEIISQSVDCRTQEQRDPTHKSYIPQSRYDSISFFVSNDPRNLPEYSDLKFPVNEEIIKYAQQKAKEMKVDIDEQLLRHLGFLFLRDPLVIFEDQVDQDNTKSTNHFENLQSTNWNSVRLKPPPSMNSVIGWRTEFRSMEVQIKDDHNAAFALLTYIMVRLLFEQEHVKINFYIPISLVDQNFQRAKKKNAVLTQKFYFRTNLEDPGKPVVDQLTCQEIFFGKQEIKFPGIFYYSNFLCQQKSETECCKCDGSDSDRIVMMSTMKFFQELTSGQKTTLATYIREFVTKHPDYKFDSVITEKINYDLIRQLVGITEGTVEDKNFEKLYQF